MGKPDSGCPDVVAGNLDYSSFDRQLQRDKCRSNSLHVILCTQLHDEFFMHLVASARCMVLFFAKGMHVSWCHPESLMHSPPCPWCLHLAVARDCGGILIPFDHLQKAAPCTPVADYLFDFDSQGPITVRSLNRFQSLDVSWLLLFELFGHVFGLLCNLFKILLVNYGKLSSGASINSDSSPPGVHQIGGPNFCQVCAA